MSGSFSCFLQLLCFMKYTSCFFSLSLSVIALDGTFLVVNLGHHCCKRATGVYCNSIPPAPLTLNFNLFPRVLLSMFLVLSRVFVNV